MNKYFVTLRNESSMPEVKKVQTAVDIGKLELPTETIFTLRLSETDMLAVLNLPKEVALDYCQKLLEKQTNTKQGYEPDSRMKDDLLEDIEHLGNVNELYYTFYVPKTNGHGVVIGKRKINAPEEYLKELQRQVVHFLRDVKGIKESEYAYAYVKGRSYTQGAEVHAQAEHTRYANFDLKNFFPSITPRVLRWALKDYDLTEREIEAIVKVSTWYDGENKKVCFPQGSVTSPYLSNLVFYKIDHRIVKMLENKFEQEFLYTRYCDDITISSKKSYAKGKLIWSLSTLLEGYGFHLNPDKTKFTTVKGKNRVTGLTVNKDFNVTIGHKRKKWLKQRYHNILLLVINGAATPMEVFEMLGELSFLYSVEPDYHRYIIDKYNRLFNRNVYKLMVDVIR